MVFYSSTVTMMHGPVNIKLNCILSGTVNITSQNMVTYGRVINVVIAVMVSRFM